MERRRLTAACLVIGAAPGIAHAGTFSTGRGNLAQYLDLAGAAFQFTAKDAGGNVLGTATYTMAAGAPRSAWLTITSDTAFRRLEVRDVGPSGADQYFGNMYMAAQGVAVAPLPRASIAGLALLAGVVCALRRRTARSRN